MVLEECQSGQKIAFIMKSFLRQISAKKRLIIYQSSCEFWGYEKRLFM